MVKTKYGYKVSVSIETDNENSIKRVIIYSPMYKVKQWSPTFCYSADFSDSEIMNDPGLNRVLMSAYGII